MPERLEKSTSVRELIDRQIAKARENGRTIDRDTAFEEVVADSMETMLTQGDIGDFMAQLKQKDKTLRDKIREWFRNLADSLKAVADEYRGAKPESPEGRLVAQMDDFVKVLQQAYAEALVEAGENYRANEGNKKTTREGGRNYSERYIAAEIDPNVLSMVSKVSSGNYSDNDKVELGSVPDNIAAKIREITGVDPTGFRTVIEARQMFHILNDHGPRGKANHSMEDPNDIARIKYVIFNPDDIRSPSVTKAYTHQRKGKARPAPTVLYEKNIGEKSYYVVQAVPDTKAKTLYIVSAFIGESGYKKEASQLINASNGPDATAKTGSVVASKNSIRSAEPIVKPESTEKRSNREYLAAVERGDMATAQRMVDEAAKKAGYPVKAWHGTPNKGVTVFDSRKIGSTTDEGLFGRGFYFSTNKLTADGYAKNGAETLPVYLNVDKAWWATAHRNVKEVADMLGMDESALTLRSYGGRGKIVSPVMSQTGQFTRHLQELGYDSVVVVHNSKDYEIVVFDAESIKSAAPVTYDDAGNVIPLSERFDTTKADIRFSDRDAGAEKVAAALERQNAKLREALAGPP